MQALILKMMKWSINQEKADKEIQIQNLYKDKGVKDSQIAFFKEESFKRNVELKRLLKTNGRLSTRLKKKHEELKSVQRKFEEYKQTLRIRSFALRFKEAVMKSIFPTRKPQDRPPSFNDIYRMQGFNELSSEENEKYMEFHKKWEINNVNLNIFRNKLKQPGLNSAHPKKDNKGVSLTFESVRNDLEEYYKEDDEKETIMEVFDGMKDYMKKELKISQLF